MMPTSMLLARFSLRPGNAEAPAALLALFPEEPHLRLPIDRICPRRLDESLYVVFGQATAEPLLLGKVVGVVQGRQVGDTLLRFIARIGIDDMQAVACGQSVQKIHQSVLVVLVEAATRLFVLEYAFNQQEAGRVGQHLFKFKEKRSAVVMGV